MVFGRLAKVQVTVVATPAAGLEFEGLVKAIVSDALLRIFS